MLESKWPSSSHGGRLRWAKLRNVLLAVAHFRQPIKRRHKSGSVGSRGGQTVTVQNSCCSSGLCQSINPSVILSFEDGPTDAEQRPRPHSTLIRQLSWSGLSESSSHESLTGSLAKSSSLSSMQPPSHSKRPPRPRRAPAG